jgi:hypothetical protein
MLLLKAGLLLQLPQVCWHLAEPVAFALLLMPADMKPDQAAHPLH